jgi:hypothetical protein
MDRPIPGSSSVWDEAVQLDNANYDGGERSFGVNDIHRV